MGCDQPVWVAAGAEGETVVVAAGGCSCIGGTFMWSGVLVEVAAGVR